jgi:hypothetical protein
MSDQLPRTNVNENPETRPGAKTTEFWISLLAGILLSVDLTGLADLLPDRYAGIALAAIAGLYSVARGIAKANTPNTPYKPEVLPAAPTAPVVPDPETRL